MQQIYMRAHMPKCDFNKVALQRTFLDDSFWILLCNGLMQLHFDYAVPDYYLNLPKKFYKWKKTATYSEWMEKVLFKIE